MGKFVFVLMALLWTAGPATKANHSPVGPLSKEPPIVTLLEAQRKNTSIVIGASSGIGRATAIHLAHLGHPVVAVARNAAALAECADEAGSSLEPLALDITGPSAPSDLKNFLEERNYAVRNIVYAAGVVRPIQPLLKSQTADLERHFATHVSGLLTILRACQDRWHHPARVLVVDSDSATKARAGWGLYCASKAALQMVCRVLQLELRDSDVALTCVRPGPVATSIVDAALAADPKEFPDREVFVRAQATGKLTEPELIAQFFGELLDQVEWNEFGSHDWDYRTRA